MVWVSFVAMSTLWSWFEFERRIQGDENVINVNNAYDNGEIHFTQQNFFLSSNMVLVLLYSSKSTFVNDIVVFEN